MQSGEADLERVFVVSLLSFPHRVQQYRIDPRLLGGATMRAAYECILSVDARGEKVTAVAVQVEAQRRQVSQHVDPILRGPLTGYVTDLGPVVGRLKEIAAFRALSPYLQKAVHALSARNMDATRAAIGEAWRAVHSDEHGADRAFNFEALITHTLESVSNSLTEQRFTKMGTAALDRVFSAAPGDLVVVGAATGTGKSTLLTTWSLSLARRGMGVGIISIEDQPEDYGGKLISELARVPAERFYGNCFESGESERIAAALQQDKGLPIHFTKIRSRTLDGVLHSMHTMRHVHSVRVVMVDYLQAIRHAEANSMRERVNETLHALMAAAAQLDVTLVLASQLRRAEGSKFHEPHDGELKESGDIENSAQCIVLLWRETDEETHPDYGVVFGKVAKVKRARAGARFALVREESSGCLVEVDRKPSGDPGGKRGFLRRVR